MIRKFILLYLTIITVRSQDFDATNADRAKIVWHDEKPSIPNYFMSQTEPNPIRVSNRPMNDDIPLWSTKESGMNLKYPKFLFSDDKVISPLWPGTQNNYAKSVPKEIQNNYAKQVPKETQNNYAKQVPKETFHDTPKYLNKNDYNRFKNFEKLESKNDVKNTDLNSMIDLHKTALQQSNKEEDVVKDKILSLAKDTENYLGAKIEIVEKTNEMYKQNNYYKLGFIVNYINTTYNALTDLMRYVEKNKENWDVLKILNAYVQIKKTKDFLTEMLSILNLLQSRQSLAGQPVDMEKKRGGEGIAWSYYDDQ